MEHVKHIKFLFYPPPSTVLQYQIKNKYKNTPNFRQSWKILKTVPLQKCSGINCLFLASWPKTEESQSCKLKYTLLKVGAKTSRPLTANPEQVYDSQTIYWFKCKKKKKSFQLTTFPLCVCGCLSLRIKGNSHPVTHRNRLLKLNSKASSFSVISWVTEKHPAGRKMPGASISTVIKLP